MADDDYKQIAASAAEAVDLFVPGIKAAVAELEIKHGPLTPNLLRAYAILQREQGEVADAILVLTKDIMVKPPEIAQAQETHLAHELAQVIAVAVYMLVNIFGTRVQGAGATPPNLVPGKDTVN